MLRLARQWRQPPAPLGGEEILWDTVHCEYKHRLLHRSSTTHSRTTARLVGDTLLSLKEMT